MPCYNPIQGFRTVGGGFTVDKAKSLGLPLTVPCNGCIGCRLMRAKEWAARCMHEASLHQHNTFVTLTYDEQHIPEDHGLCHADFQKFMKRLRFHSRQKIRYYMAGEYGESPSGLLGRPHYHALLFGIDFPDKRIWDKEKLMYRSEQLEKIWDLGFSTIQDVTYASARYVAQYCMKKITGDIAKDHYKKVDPETGELYQIPPEYNRMSNRPGIGFEWFQKYKTDVFPHDYIVINGKKQKTPAYYLKLLERESPEYREQIRKHRKEKMSEHLSEATPDRLAVKEKIAKAAQSNRTRKLN